MFDDLPNAFYSSVLSGERRYLEIIRKPELTDSLSAINKNKNKKSSKTILRTEAPTTTKSLVRHYNKILNQTEPSDDPFASPSCNDYYLDRCKEV